MKMPDFTELKKKVNIQGMMDNVKSAIETVSAPKTPPNGDELAEKFAAITQLMNSLTDMNTQQAKAITNIKAKIQALDQDMHSVKAMATELANNPHSETTTAKATKTVENIKQINDGEVDTNKPTTEEPPKDKPN